MAFVGRVRVFGAQDVGFRGMVAIRVHLEAFGLGYPTDLTSTGTMPPPAREEIPLPPWRPCQQKGVLQRRISAPGQHNFLQKIPGNCQNRT
jgi:hypothetical protein